MTHEETSLRTKRKMSASLKGLMAKKPLSKITVSEIIADCGINRKTFYYHFEDIFALLKWTLEQEAIEVIKSFDFLVEPEEAIGFVMDYVHANRHILCCAYDSLGQAEMKRFLAADLYEVTRSLIESVQAELGLRLPDDFKELVIAFYTEALVGLLIDYFKTPQKYDREALIGHILFILQNTIPNLIQAKGQ